MKKELFLNLMLMAAKLLLTPEKSIKTQRDLGADLIVVFDECTPFNVDKEYTSNSNVKKS